MKQCVWIIGASRGLGRAVAEKHAAAGNALIVSSRNVHDLESLCSHLKNRFDANAIAFELDYEGVTDAESAREVMAKLGASHSWPQVVYFRAGSIDELDFGLSSATVLNKILQTNFTAPVFLINEYIRSSKNNHIRLVVASSVAAARPRGRNIAYSTAKRALENYCFGLIHALTDRPVTIQIIRFGYMNTRLSAGQKLPFKPAEVSGIASRLLSMESKKSGLYYLPKFWFFLTMAVLSTPMFIFKKLKF